MVASDPPHPGQIHHPVLAIPHHQRSLVLLGLILTPFNQVGHTLGRGKRNRGRVSLHPTRHGGGARWEGDTRAQTAEPKQVGKCWGGLTVALAHVWWWWRTTRSGGGGEPCVVVENHAWWWWWRATGLHHPEQEHAWGSWISPPAWKYLCGWRPCGDLTGIRVVPLAFGDGQTKQNHQQVCGSIHVGDWDLPCSICAAASVRRTGCSRCRGRRCGMVRGQESWESPTRGQEKGGGLHHAACPCGDLHGVGD